MKVYFDIISIYAYISSMVNKIKLDESTMKNISLTIPAPNATAAYYLVVYRNLNMAIDKKRTPEGVLFYMCN